MKLIEIVPIAALPRELRRVRKSLKMNLRVVAKAAKVSTSTLSRVENNERCTTQAHERISAWLIASDPKMRASA